MDGAPVVPSASTVTEVLRRHGLLDGPRAGEPRTFLRFEQAAPNDLWQMDFKGHMALAQGRLHPLTVLDDHFRYALVFAACADERTGIGQAQRAAAFRRYGLPWRMPADKRGPWGSGGGEPPRLAVWLVDLDIRLVHGRPYHPQTQGKKCPRMSGAMDPIVPAPNAARLAGQLVGADARIAHRFLPAGYGLGEADLPP